MWQNYQKIDANALECREDRSECQIDVLHSSA